MGLERDGYSPMGFTIHAACFGQRLRAIGRDCGGGIYCPSSF